MLQLKSYISQIPTGSTDLTFPIYIKLFLDSLTTTTCCTYMHLHKYKSERGSFKKKVYKRRGIQYIDHTHKMYVSR